MPINIQKKSLLPQYDGRALDFIKIFAALCMVVDHIDAIWFSRAYFSMFLIGRTTFPLFCYAVAVAVTKKEAFPKQYVLRMLILAVATQPVFFFAVGIEGNVIFTLAAGAAFAAFSRALKLWQIYACYAVSVVSMHFPFPVEYGLAGIMLPSAALLVWRGEKSAYAFLLLLLFATNSNGVLDAVRTADGRATMLFVMTGLATTFLPFFVLDFAKGMPQTGRLLPKYALHVFYPGHLAALKLIALALFK
jgi:hypothetical protein